MWKLIITDDQSQHTVVNLVRDEYRIGRAENNPIRLTERNISRQHALIQRSRSGFSIQDLDSDNGVFVNGVRVHGKQDLGHRDLIQLGDYRIEVVDEALDTQEQGHSPYSGGSTAPPAARLPHRLVVLIGPNQGGEYALDGDRYLIGRDDDCDFRIDHGSVSRIHAEVRRLDADHFEIIDKGSANGLRINGHERPRAVLDSRDVVELGDVVLKYIMKGQVFQVDAAEGERIAAMSGASLPPPETEARLPLGAPLLAALGGALVILTAIFFVFRGPTAHSAGHPDLAYAVSLYEQGDVLGAHNEVKRLLANAGLGADPRSDADPSGELDPAANADPTGSELHRGGTELLAAPELAAIESAWAEALLAAARAEGDPNRRRELIFEVSQTPTVPGELRQTAARLLEQMGADEIGGAAAVYAEEDAGPRQPESPGAEAELSPQETHHPDDVVGEVKPAQDISDLQEEIPDPAR